MQSTRRIDQIFSDYVCQDISAAYAKGVSRALPQISYERFHVIAMAFDAMDGVRRLEMKEEPQAVKETPGDNERKLLKSLTWGMRRNPQGWSVKQTDAMHWLAALSAQECVRLAD